MNILFSITLGIALLLIALLLRQLKANRANVFLVGLLQLVVIGCLYSLYLSHTANLGIIALVNALPACFGPLVYLYVKKSLFPGQKIKPAVYLVCHLPFAVAWVLSYWANVYPDNLLLDIVLNFFTKIIVGLLYLFATWQLLKKYRESLLGTFSNLNGVELRWLNFIVATTIFTFFVYLALMLLWYSGIAEMAGYENISAVLVFIFTISISYFGISHSTVFYRLSAVQYPAAEAGEEEDTGPAYEMPADVTQPENPAWAHDPEKERLKDEKLEKLYRELLRILNEEKPYLDENLAITDLAKRMNVHSKYLSALINKKFGKTFFELINHYRVREFNERATKPENKHITLLSIAFECGFGSKSAFNRAYRHEMNMPPSEFIKGRE